MTRRKNPTAVCLSRQLSSARILRFKTEKHQMQTNMIKDSGSFSVAAAEKLSFLDFPQCEKWSWHQPKQENKCSSAKWSYWRQLKEVRAMTQVVTLEMDLRGFRIAKLNHFWQRLDWVGTSKQIVLQSSHNTGHLRGHSHSRVSTTQHFSFT